jgi:hypothetical protein
MAHRETRQIATYLKNGVLWVGQFVVERDDLDFGDDRRDSAHGLSRYVRVRVSQSAHWMQARFTAAHHAAEEKHAALREMHAALERLKFAA